MVAGYPRLKFIIDSKEKNQMNINTVSASMEDPSSSLTEETRPSAPASKFFMEAP